MHSHGTLIKMVGSAATLLARVPEHQATIARAAESAARRQGQASESSKGTTAPSGNTAPLG